MSDSARAFICGCSGLELSGAERQFMRSGRPWGLILFRRNIGDPAQVLRLTSAFRELVGREDAPVLIDQEGGRVQRMGPPHWRAFPPAAAFSAAAANSGDAARLARLGARLLAEDLRACAINVDCAPVLDVPARGSHEIIGDRAYGDEAGAVAALGRAACEGLLAGGVLPVIKHMPGHGRAAADSHLELPVVRASRSELEAVDFAPFRALADMPMAMTAHIVYEAVDPERPATVSPRLVAEVIRGWMGYDGLVMSDDLSMKALAGSFAEKTAALFAAGLDLALHCNGDLAEAAEVAAHCPWIDGAIADRANRALDLLEAPVEPIDPVEAWRTLDARLAQGA